jgi:hypothetical protein
LEVAAATQDMRYLSRWFQAQSSVPNSKVLVDAIESHLNSVEHYLSLWFGANPTSILGHLQAAQAALLRLAPLSYVRGCLPSFIMQARKALAANDLQLIGLENLARKARSTELTEDDRQTIVACLNGASEQVRRAQSRLQSFRNVIVVTASFLLLVVCIIGIVSLNRRTLLPICFVRNASNSITTVACPVRTSDPFIDSQEGGEPQRNIPIEDVDSVIEQTAGPLDVPLIEFVGFIAAALAAALAIRNVRGDADPYSIPLALAFLKLPAGALTALLGLVLIRAGLVPGIDSLDSSAEIIAWALVFGYAQQLFTGVVDRQARSVLDQSAAAPSQLPRSTGTLQ